MRSIDPRTSRMLSERTTIWATSPHFSSFDLASEHNSWKTGFRFVTGCQFLPIISNYKWEILNRQKCFGDAGHRSPYLSLAKRELYHLSYIPVLFKLRASFEQNSWKTGFRFVTNCQFLPIISNYKWELSNPQKRFGDAEHRSAYLSHAKRALYHLSYIPVMISLRSSFWTQFMKYQFPFVTSCQFIPIISKYKPELSYSQKWFGDAGHRSPYFSHAKRALYHLSYIPVLFKLRASFWTQFMKNRFSICNELSIPSHYQQLQLRIVESSKTFWRCGASIRVPLACKASALPFELHPRNDFASI